MARKLIIRLSITLSTVILINLQSLHVITVHNVLDNKDDDDDDDDEQKTNTNTYFFPHFLFGLS